MGIISRTELVDYALRKLGEPVIKVNVDAAQIDDRVNDALQWYQYYHSDGVEKYYLKHLITTQDVANGYIDIGDPLIMSINKCFPIDSNTLNMFSFKYQLRLNDFYNFNNVSITQYTLARQNLAMLEFFFTTEKQFRFNVHQNRIYLDIDWADALPGQYLIFSGLRALDPNAYPDVYNDFFLKEFLTELIREQWAENISKFGNISLLGGVTLNADKMMALAQTNKAILIKRLQTEFQEPPYMQLG